MKSTALRIGSHARRMRRPRRRRVRARDRQSGGTGTAPPKIEPLGAVGNGEGQLNLIAWAGYAENGSNDKTVDWVTPFEKQTGCKVNVKVGNTSDEMVQLMRTGQYDGVSASGDATLRLIYAGDVAPGEYLTGAELRDDLVLPQGQAVELGGRPDVRHSPRLGRQPADVQHSTWSPTRPTRGVRCSPTRASTRAR